MAKGLLLLVIPVQLPLSPHSLVFVSNTPVGIVNMCGGQEETDPGPGTEMPGMKSLETSVSPDPAVRRINTEWLDNLLSAVAGISCGE